MKRLLIVDDEPDVRKTLALVFASAFDVLEAESGHQAIRLARARRPDLVFLDVNMPGIGGIATLRALKSDQPQLIVIMLTAAQDIGIARRSLDHGASMYVTKPYDPRYLRDEVERLLTCAAGVRSDDDKPWRIA